MSDFDTRPKGTVIHGTFSDFAAAERALRVLKNAGYVRAAVGSPAEEATNGQAVVTVDAAATGALRAAEILEEYGAELRYASQTEASRAALTEPVLPRRSAAAEQLQTERKPRIRKNVRLRAQGLEAPLAPQDAIIRTRGSDVMPLGDSFASTEPFTEET